ncbi:DnaD domain-containing protein [Paenibacillus xylaniclasticus]|uniref:DnaD domain-containing protein n=1 Tax=Paenibacillus xylaniclasticus TaxID=588083 RepID=UPI000FDB334B|nr:MULTISPECIES: DnaD domain-containing protein [Paenibacillus]GFN30699.1 DNA replication protein DnaD [Paenibacillus curdlanolyticus]
MKDEIWKAYARGLADAMSGGGVFIPSALLRTYRALGVEESEMMLLVHLMAFRESEGNEFPTPEQLADRMGKPINAVVQSIRKLMKEGLLTIEEDLDPVSGVRFERYDWTSWLIRSGQHAAAMKREGKTLSDSSAVKPASGATSTVKAEGESAAQGADNLFTVFEQEFGRPLSPMECETIAAWLDQDKYSDEIIRFALKEAVFAGKLHFRYIDRILLEWSRNRVTNAEEARAHAQKFRGGRS